VIIAFTMPERRMFGDAYEQTVALRLADSAALRKWGWALLELDKSEDALALATRALEVDPADIDACRLRARSLFMLDRDKQALKAFERVLRAEPDSREWIYLGHSLCELARYEDAVAAFDRGFALVPDHKLALADRARSITSAATSRRWPTRA
jgi:tetratricopeptide (TPR) repeat protein